MKTVYDEKTLQRMDRDLFIPMALYLASVPRTKGELPLVSGGTDFEPYVRKNIRDYADRYNSEHTTDGEPVFSFQEHNLSRPYKDGVLELSLGDQTFISYTERGEDGQTKPIKDLGGLDDLFFVRIGELTYPVAVEAKSGWGPPKWGNKPELLSTLFGTFPLLLKVSRRHYWTPEYESFTFYERSGKSHYSTIFMRYIKTQKQKRDLGVEGLPFL